MWEEIAQKVDLHHSGPATSIRRTAAPVGGRLIAHSHVGERQMTAALGVDATPIYYPPHLPPMGLLSSLPTSSLVAKDSLILLVFSDYYTAYYLSYRSRKRNPHSLSYFFPFKPYCQTYSSRVLTSHNTSAAPLPTSIQHTKCLSHQHLLLSRKLPRRLDSRLRWKGTLSSSTSRQRTPSGLALCRTEPHSG